MASWLSRVGLSSRVEQSASTMRSAIEPAPLALIRALALEVPHPPALPPSTLEQQQGEQQTLVQEPREQAGSTLWENVGTAVVGAAALGACVAYPPLLLGALLIPATALAPPPNQVWQVGRQSAEIENILQRSGPAHRQLLSDGELRLPGGGINYSRGYGAADLKRTYFCPTGSRDWTSELDLISPGHHDATGVFVIGGRRDLELQNRSIRAIPVREGAQHRPARALLQHGLTEADGVLAYVKNTFYEVTDNSTHLHTPLRAASADSRRTDPESRHRGAIYNVTGRV